MNEPNAFDPPTFKAATREAWDEAANGWDRQTPQLHAWLADATQAMLDAARIGAGDRVLDIAAGAGDQTLEIARRVGSSGRVLATDISPAILERAAENARRAGLTQVETRVADAEFLGLEGAGFDAAVSRLGLMLCPNPLQALREVRAALKPGGYASMLVFSQPRGNPCIGILMATAFEHAGLTPPDPFQPGSLFSLGQPGRLEQLFHEAGFVDVTAATVPAVFRLPSSRAYVEFIRTSATPVRQILGRLDDAQRAAAWSAIEARLDVFQTPDGWQGPNELLLAAGRR